VEEEPTSQMLGQEDVQLVLLAIHVLFQVLMIHSNSVADQDIIVQQVLLERQTRNAHLEHLRIVWTLPLHLNVRFVQEDMHAQ